MSNPASYHKGRKAFYKPEELAGGHFVQASNPYHSTDDFEKHREWDRGFNDAFAAAVSKQKARERRLRKLKDKE